MTGRARTPLAPMRALTLLIALCLLVGALGDELSELEHATGEIAREAEISFEGEAEMDAPTMTMDPPPITTLAPPATAGVATIDFPPVDVAALAWKGVEESWALVVLVLYFALCGGIGVGLSALPVALIQSVETAPLWAQVLLVLLVPLAVGTLATLTPLGSSLTFWGLLLGTAGVVATALAV
jgi:hypothetical protein